MNNIDISTALSKSVQLAGKAHISILQGGYNMQKSMHEHTDMKLQFTQNFLDYLLAKDDFDLALSSLEFAVDNVESIFKAHAHSVLSNNPNAKSKLVKIIKSYDIAGSIMGQAIDVYPKLQEIQKLSIEKTIKNTKRKGFNK